MAKGDLHERSVILNLQQALFKKLIPSSNAWLSPDGTTLIVANLSVSDIALVKLFCNSLSQTETRMYLMQAKVYLDGQIHPTHIPGFKEILKNSIKQSEITAILADSKFHTPFTSFKLTTTTTGNAGQLVDQLASMNPELPNTSALTKTFTLYFDPEDPDGGELSSEADKEFESGN
jgi:hypothetical protein